MGRTPSVEIEFGGEFRHLIFDFNARAEMEDVAGTYQSNVPKLKAMRTMVWALLLAETLDRRGRETERTLSLLQVGEILEQMSEANLEELSAAVHKAVGLSQPEPETADPTIAVAATPQA